jgi:hypothetical protein
MRALPILLLLLIPVTGMAQSMDAVAHVPRAAPERTADDVRLGIAPGAVAGTLELELPRGTEAVELLNGRGGLKHTLPAGSWHRLPVELLRPGTWTLRAKVNGRYLVRRFLVHGGNPRSSLPDMVNAQRRSN